MVYSTPILALTTLTFCAAAALLVGAYKANSVLRNSTSKAFLAAFSLITLGLGMRLLVETLYLPTHILGLEVMVLPIMSNLFLLSAYTVLLLVAERIRNAATKILFALLLVLAVILSTYLPAVMHVTTATLLSLLAYRFYMNFLQKNSVNALIVYVAFLLLLVAQVAAVFMNTSLLAHYAYLVLTLLGYFALFVMLWRVRQ
ncbi:MAG: hypothetical protein ACMXYD_00275 [Candidatus Woesearchaeota archaeon]